MNRLSIGFLAGAFACAFAIHAEVAQAAKERVLYSFQNNGSDGIEPFVGLIDVNRSLYGTTPHGGTYDEGTVFVIDIATGTEAIVHSFDNNQEDGILPLAGLSRMGGMLYGTTAGGGTSGCGTVFSIDLATGVEAILHSFADNDNDGCGPLAGLISVNRILYGTTGDGGTRGHGTVFSIAPKTKTEAVLYSFCSEETCTDGNGPQASLLNVKGTLYSTTNMGGTYNGGTVFSIDLTTRAETVLHSFQDNGSDGYYPGDSLIDVKGTLYGTTDGGGVDNRGTVFSVEPSTGSETVPYSFKGGQDGAQPIASLITVGSQLYGTTADGGGFACNAGCGTVFSFDLKNGREAVRYSFHDYGGDGTDPVAGLIDVNGTLYGTTLSGGAYDYGTVFKINP